MIAPLTAAVLAASMTIAPAPASAKAPKPCKDRIVKVIKAAGWKGRDVRTAYGVTWRESNQRPDVVGAGSYGLFQLQASAWSSRPWWNWSAVLTADGNARMAHRIWKITGWSAWGINRNGDGIDATYYGGWSASTQYAWIWKPYTVGLAKYDRLPAACHA